MTWVAVLSLFAQAQAQPKAPGFDHLTCKDKYGRTINYYLSSVVPDKKLPIAVIVLGSGGQSVWMLRDGKVGGGLQSLLLSRVKDHLRVLVVEKPGVQFGFNPPQPGSAEGCSPEFLEEHTLDRWTNAVDAALQDGLKQPGIDPSRVLATGHSEGGIVVARLAAQNPKVTDVAPLAGGGPGQLVDLEKLIGKDHAANMWSQVQADPMSTTKFVWGHPHRRWSTFLASSTLEEAKKSKARFFIAQGTKDRSVDPDGAVLLHDELKKLGRDVTLHTVADGDHGFSTDPNDRTGKGFIDVFDRLLSWFLK